MALIQQPLDHTQFFDLFQGVTALAVCVAPRHRKAIPTLPNAQQSDASYCQALADKYQRYTSNMTSRRPDANISVDLAISQCASKPADSIPVLEKALKDNDLDLPKR